MKCSRWDARERGCRWIAAALALLGSVSCAMGQVSLRQRRLQRRAAIVGIAMGVALVGCSPAPHGNREAFAVYVGTGVDLPKEERFRVELEGRKDEFGEPIFREAVPLLTSKHIARAWSQPHGGAIVIELTDDGQRMLEREVDRYLRHRLIVVLDGEVLIAPVAQSPLQSIGIGPSSLAGPSADEVVRRLNELAAER